MKLPKTPLWLKQFGTQASENGLRPNSPVRVWVTRRRKNSAAASGAALLGALTDPAANWTDRIVGYSALREIDLSSTERAHAGHLLSQALARFRAGTDLLTRLGKFVIPVGVPCLLGSLLFAMFVGVPGIGLGLIGVCVLPLLLFTAMELLESKRTAMAQRAALTTLAQIGDPECIVALVTHVLHRSRLRQEAVRTLTAILPRVTSEYFRQLSYDAEQALLMLVKATDENIALAALDALERLGDGRYASALAATLVWVRSPRVDVRGAVVLSLLKARQEPAAAQIALYRLPEIPVAEHPLRLWLARRKASSPRSSNATLLHALSVPHADWADRARGYQALCTLALSPSERTQASHLLSHALQVTGAEGAGIRRVSHASALALLYGVAVGALIALASATFFATDTDPFLLRVLLSLSIGSAAAGLFTVFATPLFWFGLSLFETKGVRAIQRAAVSAASQIGGPECIAALNDHVGYHTAIQAEALLAIKQILPTITPDCYGRLPANAGPTLCKMAESFDEDLAWLAVDAIGRAGGGNCLEVITHIVHASPSKQVRTRAAAILPLLLERYDRETSAGTLLRPSQSAPTEHLLLPIYAAEPDAANLLRASHNTPQNVSPSRTDP